MLNGESCALISECLTNPYIHSLAVYGAKVDVLRARFGEAVPIVELEKALSSKKYKLVAFTHVDTSTGKPIGQAAMNFLTFV